MKKRIETCPVLEGEASHSISRVEASNGCREDAEFVHVVYMTNPVSHLSMEMCLICILLASGGIQQVTQQFS